MSTCTETCAEPRTENRVSLVLGETSLTLRLETPSSTTIHTLPVGLVPLTTTFGEQMPTALALEQAIAVVEDAVMPAARHMPEGVQTLYSCDPQILEVIARAMGASALAPARLASIDAIESLFSTLVRQAEQPAHRDAQLVQSARFAAALLILRECLHHWGLRQVSNA